MAKRALFVGVNEYPLASDRLKGCVNDAMGWSDLLSDHFDFPRSSIKVITDTDATKRAVVAALKRLLARARSGDVFVFGNSSHGSQVPDEDGDEKMLDEVLCPYDADDNVLRDDELREMFSAIPAGVRLTAILDNCHSGSGTRAPAGPGTLYRRARYMDPQHAGAPAEWSPRGKSRGGAKYPESQMRELLLAGCRSDESSYDADLEGKFHGAMTFYALRVIEAANYRLTYEDLVRRVKRRLTAAEFDQHPRIEGRDANKGRQIFT